MAIAKTNQIISISIYPAPMPDSDDTDNMAHPSMSIQMIDIYADSVTGESDEVAKTINLGKFTDGEDTDVSNYDQLIQDIAATIWS
jgi:hypothetical protein